MIKNVHKCTCDKCGTMTEIPNSAQPFWILIDMGWTCGDDGVKIYCPDCSKLLDAPLDKIGRTEDDA